jgi:hypothetical protein
MLTQVGIRCRVCGTIIDNFETFLPAVGTNQHAFDEFLYEGKLLMDFCQQTLATLE